MVISIKKLSLKLTIFGFLSSVIFSSLVIMTIPASACGCGMVVVGNPSNNVGWSYSNDFTEQSYINLDKNTEKLIISLDIQQRSNDAVLIVPIPSKPQSVQANVLADTPLFSGYSVTDQANQELPKIRDGVLATQIYPAIPGIINSLLSQPQSEEVQNSTGATMGASLNAAAAPPATNQISVYQHLEKDGLVTEVLTAANSSALYNYLTQKGLNVAKDSIPLIRDYISGNFSFVVSWINPNTSYSSAKGLQINFPSKSIYYPLKPGSVYSGPGLQKAIYVVGYISPNLYADIKPSTTVDYFYSGQPTQFPGFYTSGKTYGFTRLLINTDPKSLTQDLYMSKRTPLKILNAQAINVYTFLYAVYLLIVMAFAAVYLAARLTLPKHLRLVEIILKLWIASWFTIIGTIIASVLFLPRGKRLRFILLYSILFTVFVWIFWYLNQSWYPIGTSIGM